MKPLASALVVLLLPVLLRRVDADGSPFKTYTDDLLSCKPKRQPEEYGNISSLRPITIKPCTMVENQGLLDRNSKTARIAHKTMSSTVEVVLLTEFRGGVHYLEVITDGDYKGFDIAEKPKRTFRGHSCLNRDSFCNVVSALPIPEGFFALDRHRVLRFNFTWLPDISVLDSDLFDVVVGSYGEFNVGKPAGVVHSENLLYPSEMAEFSPRNITHLDGLDVTPFTPQSYKHFQENTRPRFIFVTDTGNHRVVILDVSQESRMDFVGQFGQTGVPRSDAGGFNWPLGIACWEPGLNVGFIPVVANVFVADELNNRLVKLDLHDTEDGYKLRYGGEYGTDELILGGHRGLDRPVGVGLFRHYILVAEANGNSITVLMMDYLDPQRFIFVTHMQPAREIKLTGYISVSQDGYIWYTYTKAPMIHGMGTMYLTESLRESQAPHKRKDILDSCVNESWFNNYVRFDAELYRKTLTDMLTVANVNWRFEDWVPEGYKAGEEMAYVSLRDFNITRPPGLDFDKINRTVFKDKMVFCQPPPPPTAPPMSGSTMGVATGDRSTMLEAATAAPQSSLLPALLVAMLAAAAA